MCQRDTDLDETRRLLYMALAASRTDRYELAGTLVNALVHHQQIGLDADVVMYHVIRAIEANQDGYGVDQNWLRQQIERITRELLRASA